MRSLFAAMTACLLLHTPALQAETYDLPIKEHIFENGLKLLVIERPGDNRVAAKIWTDMGAINEISGEYGSAHFLEHLMFKGTKTLGTSNWEAEKPLVEELRATEKLLIEELNRARNDIRQRGVFHDYKHKASTPEIDRLRAKIAELDEEINQYAVEGDTMKWYQGNGGTNLTAQTEQEYMHFDIELPANRVDIFLRVEADRMENTIFRRFDQERMILVEQRLGNMSQNTTHFREAMDATVGTTSRIFIPEGYMTDFAEYTRTYERYLYETFFVVNNTTLVFIGGVTMNEMIQKVEKYFGHMKPTPEPERYYGQEPIPTYEKRIVFRTNKLSPRVDMRFQIPGVGHPDRPAFEVIGEVVQNRMQAALNEQGLNASANAYTRVIHTLRFGLPGSLNFEVTGSESDLEAIEAVMLDTVSNLAANPASMDELAFAKKTLRTEWYRMASNANALANEIGHFEVMDSWKTLKPFLEARDNASAADVQRLIKQYFIANNRSTGVVISEETE